jgi:6-pyruvoyltetrahydropterin/6-carboxytetrahydropterin synthase
MKLIVRSHFDAAHFLPGYNGPCSRLHGHRWEVEIEVFGMVDNETGMIMDFKEIKENLKKILPDHLFLNEHWPDIIPTAENIARKLFSDLQGLMPTTLLKLRLWESPDAGVEYP